MLLDVVGMLGVVEHAIKSDPEDFGVLDCGVRCVIFQKFSKIEGRLVPKVQNSKKNDFLFCEHIVKNQF